VSGSRGTTSMRSEPGKRLRIAIAMVLALALAISLSSSTFSSPSSQEPPPPGELRVTGEDDGGEVELSEGQVLVVTLEANPSTGYTWQMVEVEAEGEGEGILHQAGPIEFQPQSVLLGAPGTQTLRFEPAAEGESVLRLVYLRPWQPRVEPARTFSLRVRVAGPLVAADNTPTTPVGDPLIESPTLGPDQPQPDLPSAFDWCDFGGCTPVRDQGPCGSCWAFGTVGPLELNILIQRGLASDLSEQYLVSCNTESWGCNGGLWAHDYHAWKVPPGELGAGAVDESDFPYVARDDPCEPPHLHRHKIDLWHYVGNEWSVPSIADIKQAIYDHGPVSAAICVDSAFQSYSGGVFLGTGCSAVNHAIVLVGWDDSQGTNGVWFLRNSWGPGWGEDGYMRIGYGVSKVGFGANYVEYSSSNCYSLTASVSPAGSGTITVEPPFNCRASGYQPGTEVDVTASPSSGWDLTGWSGAASGDSQTVSVTMDSHKAVTAHFRADLCVPWLVLPLGLTVCWVVRQRRLSRSRNCDEC